MKQWFVITLCFLTSCAQLADQKDLPQLYTEKLSGEHAALALCMTDRLRSDGRTYLRLLHFKNRQYPDVQASEITALDTRYLRHMIPTYAPTNPDAVLLFSYPEPEIMPYAQRNPDSGAAVRFSLFLKRTDHATVIATLQGDRFLGDIAWQVLQSCATATTQP